MKVMNNDSDMLEEYDFSKGVRGKHAKRYAEGTNVVLIDSDVAEFFPDHDTVNDALRSLIPIIKNCRTRALRWTGKSWCVFTFPGCPQKSPLFQSSS